MTIGLLLALFAAALALGAAMHVALYAPTAALPPMWRNMARYVTGVVAVLALLGVAIALAPEMTLWAAYALMAALFAMTGLGVALGYIAMDD